jgi:hypothetical protein
MLRILTGSRTASHALFVGEPGGAALCVYLERDVEADGVGHFFGNPLGVFVGFGDGDLEDQFIVDLEDRSVELAPRQGITIPRGVVHRTRAPERSVVLMMEGAGVVPTGD